jgi:mono/diheme cytochrome c family protein
MIGARAWLAFGLAAATPCAAAADVIAGQRLYVLHCASCHGQDGRALMPNAPSFERGERLMQPDAVLAASIRRGRFAMPAYAGVLGDREIFDVIAYLRTLR